MGGLTGYIPVADANRPTLLAAQGGGSMGILNNGPGVLYVANRRYFAWNDGFGVIPIPVGGTFAADGSQDLYGMPAPYSTLQPNLVQTTSWIQSLTGNFSKAVTVGNCPVVVICAYNSTSGDTPSITSVTIGGTTDNFAQAVSQVSAYSSVYQLVSIWADFNCKVSGQSLITIAGNNLSPATNIILAAVFELGNMFTGSVDKTASNTGTGTAWSSGATATTTAAYEAWFGAAALLGTDSTLPSAPWINTQTSGAASVIGYQFPSAEAAATYAASTSASDLWSAAVATLKPQSFAAGTPAPAYVSLLSSSITAPP